MLDQVAALPRENDMKDILCSAWLKEGGQDVAEYALLLATILAIVVASVTAIGTQANVVFNTIKSALGG